MLTPQLRKARAGALEQKCGAVADFYRQTKQFCSTRSALWKSERVQRCSHAKMVLPPTASGPTSTPASKVWEACWSLISHSTSMSLAEPSACHPPLLSALVFTTLHPADIQVSTGGWGWGGGGSSFFITLFTYMHVRPILSELLCLFLLEDCFVFFFFLFLCSFARGTNHQCTNYRVSGKS